MNSSRPGRRSPLATGGQRPEVTKQSRDCAGASHAAPRAGAGGLRLGGTTVGVGECAGRSWKMRQKDGAPSRVEQLGWGGGVEVQTGGGGEHPWGAEAQGGALRGDTEGGMGLRRRRALRGEPRESKGTRPCPPRAQPMRPTRVGLRPTRRVNVPSVQHWKPLRPSSWRSPFCGQHSSNKPHCLKP